MGTLVPIVTLLVVLMLGLIVNRIGTTALIMTGLSPELAKFQARSAFIGVGFTTSESERVMEHPVRRRIIMWLILVGNAGFVAAVSALLPVFISTGEGNMSVISRVFWLSSGLIILWLISISKWLDRQLSRVIRWALLHWTHLDAQDYSSLLHLGAGYSVCEMKVEEGDWVADKTLSEVRLSDEGVQVLGIRRDGGEYVGAPTGATYLRAGDLLLVYGKSQYVAELDTRRAGVGGDKAHAARVAEVRGTVLRGPDEELIRLREEMK